VLDYAGDGDLVGIEIDNASRKVRLDRLVLTQVPGEVERVG